VQLRFKTREAADAAFVSVRDYLDENPAQTFGFSDDWDHRVTFRARDVQHIGMLDVEKDMTAQTEIGLMQHRAQAAMQRAINNDPILKVAAMMHGAQGGLIS
jgi:hypothetical protein